MAWGQGFRCLPLALAGLAGLVGGCASGTNIRASDELYHENPIGKVAIISEGKVNFPRMGGGGKVVVLTASKQATEALLTQAKQSLGERGYEVVFAEPVAIGYASQDWWYANDDAEDEEEHSLTKIPSQDPVYLYSHTDTDSDVVEAADRVFRSFEQALMRRELDRFQPAREDVKRICEMTGADTLCLHRVYGVKYSIKRKVGAFALGVLAGMFGAYTGGPNTTDMAESLLVFMDGESGEVLWQHGVYAPTDPTEPSVLFTENVLRHFPRRGEPMDAEACGPGENGLTVCKGDGYVTEKAKARQHEAEAAARAAEARQKEWR